jgi:hypothetical protein
MVLLVELQEIQPKLTALKRLVPAVAPSLSLPSSRQMPHALNEAL